MGRAGILYSHVAKAAAALVADGKNPTVDTIRVALGDTGSKSTIAPLLKRWKAEHQETILEADLGMPAELLQAVKNVYEKMRADINEQLEQAQTTHQEQIAAASEHVQQINAEKIEFGKINTELRSELEVISSDLKQLQSDYHAATVTLSAAQAENIGLNQRLADRATEINAMNQQLNQTRKQFEHYQEAIARQRSEDRQASDKRIARLEQDLTDSQRKLADAQLLIAQQATQITHLGVDSERWQQIAQAAQEDLGAVGTERDQLVYQVKELSEVRNDFDKRLNLAQDALTEARIAAAMAQKDVEMQAERLVNIEEKVTKLDQERGELMQKLVEREAYIAELSRVQIDRHPLKNHRHEDGFHIKSKG